MEKSISVKPYLHVTKTTDFFATIIDLEGRGS